MENASKALLIAGGVLLTILVLSLAAYLFKQMGSNSSEIYAQMRENEINEFNQQFFNYDGRNDLNIQDVVTIINLAKDNNDAKRFPVVIQVLFRGTDALEKNIERLLMDNVGETGFKCTVEYAPNSNLVGKITIQ